MPLYDYHCPDCRAQDTRLAALDDHTARCTRCGGLMRRQGDIFDPYFPPKDNCPWCVGQHPGTSEICLNHEARLWQEIAQMQEARA